MNIYIVRHGETTWNVMGRYQGRQNSDLSPLGILQANALSDYFAELPLARIISSPLSRCVATAEPLAFVRDMRIEVDSKLIEIAHGSWENRLRDEIAKNEPELYKRWRAEPASVTFEGGENLAAVARRWKAFVDGFSPSGDTLIVTHDAVVRVAILERTGRPLNDLWSPTVTNGGFAHFQIADGAWRLVTECERSHLQGLQAGIERQAL